MCRQRPIKLLLCGGLVAFALVAPARADYDAGIKAFNSSDYEKAFSEWYAAANSGDAKAQFRLGQLYEQGFGIPQNFVVAHLWYNLAAARGLGDAAKARNNIAAKMSAEQVSRAQQLATDWKPAAIRYFEAGIAALKAKRLDEAIADFNASLQLKSDALTLLFLGEAYRRNNQLDLARTAFGHVLELVPSGDLADRADKADSEILSVQAADATFKAGFELFNAKDFKGAVAYFSKGLELKPDPKAEFYLGEAYRLEGKTADARSSYERSIELDPHSDVAEKARQELARSTQSSDITSSAPMGTWVGTLSSDSVDLGVKERATLVMRPNMTGSIVIEVSYLAKADYHIAGCPDDTKSGNYTVRGDFRLNMSDKNLHLEPLADPMPSGIYPVCMSVIEPHVKNRIAEFEEFHWDGNHLSSDESEFNPSVDFYQIQ